MKPVKITANITDESIRKVMNDLNKYAFGRRARIQQETDMSLLRIQRGAKRAAPVNKQVGHGGRLRASINVHRDKIGIGGAVVAETHYAAYQEFGTGKAVKVPLGLEDYAMQFKGAGKREVNLPPQPFLFPAAEAERPNYVKKIKEILR